MPWELAGKLDWTRVRVLKGVRAGVVSVIAKAGISSRHWSRWRVAGAVDFVGCFLGSCGLLVGDGGICRVASSPKIGLKLVPALKFCSSNFKSVQ